MKKLMFICSGNTCRSPLAEGLFKKFLAEKHITEIEVSSGGISAFPGDEVSANSVIVAEKRGVDIYSHRAKRINAEDILTTDLFVCMSTSHASALRSVCDESQITVLNVSDPYGGDVDIYENCARQIEENFSSVLEKIQKTPVIRRMNEKHIKSLAKIETECFSEPWSENALTDELQNETARFFVLEDNGEVLGYIGANNIGGEVYITNVAVKENCRGKGYGRMLVKKLICQSIFENADFVTLEVRKSNIPAIKLYEKCGFAFVGERKDFYSKPKENALIYTLYIKE